MNQQQNGQQPKPFWGFNALQRYQSFTLGSFKLLLKH